MALAACLDSSSEWRDAPGTCQVVVNLRVLPTERLHPRPHGFGMWLERWVRTGPQDEKALVALTRAGCVTQSIVDVAFEPS